MLTLAVSWSTFSFLTPGRFLAAVDAPLFGSGGRFSAAAEGGGKAAREPNSEEGKGIELTLV